MSLRYLSADISYEGWARADYVADRIELAQYEAEVEAILRGQVPERMGMRVGGLPSVAEGMETKGELR